MTWLDSLIRWCWCGISLPWSPCGSCSCWARSGMWNVLHYQINVKIILKKKNDKISIYMVELHRTEKSDLLARPVCLSLMLHWCWMFSKYTVYLNKWGDIEKTEAQVQAQVILPMFTVFPWKPTRGAKCGIISLTWATAGENTRTRQGQSVEHVLTSCRNQLMACCCFNVSCFVFRFLPQYRFSSSIEAHRESSFCYRDNTSIWFHLVWTKDTKTLVSLSFSSGLRNFHIGWWELFVVYCIS